MVTTRARKKAVLAQEEAEVARKLLLPFRLLDLPAEIIGNISDHLDDDDLINLRRVCRALTAHSANAFGQRFFRHLVVILHPTSLTTLFEISRHKTLSKYVHHLTVSGERIGYDISLSVVETVHKDLQTSVERSRMDLSILIEVLRELKNLQTVRIDRFSFQNDVGWVRKTKVKCGRGLMFNQGSVMQKWDVPEDQSYDRVYELTLQALVQAQMDGKVELDLQFENLHHPRNTPKYLDVDSESWREGLCRQLRYFSTVGHMDPDWLGQLLSLSTGITKLELRQHYENLNSLLLAREPAGVFSFPGLRQLNISQAVIRYETWQVFLGLHAAVLEKVALQSVGLQNGTWHHTLATLETMPRLNNLSLNMLLEQVPYHDTSADPLHPRIWGPGNFSLRNQAAIRVALNAMRAEPRTVAVGWAWMGPFDGPNGEVYDYAVDCKGYTTIVDDGS